MTEELTARSRSTLACEHRSKEESVVIFSFLLMENSRLGKAFVLEFPELDKRNIFFDIWSVFALGNLDLVSRWRSSGKSGY